MRNILKVFIASPSDLGDERRISFQIVAELNKSLRRLNWTIELFGWEDTLPGYGRPQAIINRDVEQCDLFIGLVWRRWGTPPAQSGTFSSGFEEEFSIAKDRRERATTPEIWIFFKKVDLDQVSDPGAQLKRVIEFRDSLVESKTVLFKKFESSGAWADMLREYLLTHVFKISRRNDDSPQHPSEPTIGSAFILPSEMVAGAPAAASQIAMLGRFLGPFLSTGDLNQSLEAISDQREITFVAVRALLFSSALVRASGSSATSFPTHELNTLYRYRERLQTTDEELFIILRSILADVHDLEPGWYWFRNSAEEEIVERLVHVIVAENDTPARARSFELLEGIRSSGDPILRGVLLSSMPTLSPDLQKAAWAYLAVTVTTEEIAVLRQFGKGSWLEPRIDWLNAWTAAGRVLDRFLPQCSDHRLITSRMARSIETEIPHLSDQSLRVIASMPRKRMSSAARDELRLRGIFIEEKAPAPQNGLNLNSLSGLCPPENLSSGSLEREDERYARVGQESSGDLREKLTWYSVEGPVIYRVLGERGEIARATIRQDLSSQFQRMHERSLESLQQTLTAKRAFEIDQEFADLHEFIIDQYTKNAFKCLELHPVEDDLALARQYVTNYEARRSALNIIIAAGDTSDIDRLIDIADSTSGVDQASALAGVHKLTADKLTIARRLIDSDKRELRRSGFLLAADLSDEELLPFLEKQLSDAAEEIRVAAVAHLQRRFSQKAMEQILDRYLAQETYYYNVATWLDRVIYAPPALLSRFREELEAGLDM
jgi:hypothetical protein